MANPVALLVVVVSSVSFASAHDTDESCLELRDGALNSVKLEYRLIRQQALRKSRSKRFVIALRRMNITGGSRNLLTLVVGCQEGDGGGGGANGHLPYNYINAHFFNTC